MRPMLMLALAAVLSIAVPAAEVTGVWVGSMDTPMGVITTTITIKAGEPFSGTVGTDAFGEAKIENAKRDGDTISFEINIEPGKVAYEGTVTDNELKLTVTGTTGNKYQMNCKRKT